MTNVVQLKSKKSYTDLYYTLSTTQLEDGSIWFRYKSLSKNTWSEWVKIDD